MPTVRRFVCISYEASGSNRFTMSNDKLWQRSQQRYYFQNEDMDFYFKWVLANQLECGAAHGECYYVASRIKDGDPESWAKGWLDMARRVEAQAVIAGQKGHRVTAREAYLRAFTYCNTASIFIRPRDVRLRPTWQSAQTLLPAGHDLPGHASRNHCHPF